MLQALPDPSELTAAIASSALESIHTHLAEQLKTVDWASIALATQQAKKEVNP